MARSAPPSAEAADRAADRVTDLARLVAAIDAAAEGMPRQPGPWLPPLPDKVIVDELPGIVAFGLIDLPKGQDRGVLSLNLEEGGHLAVVGSAQSGRSTVLRTIAGSLAARVSPDDTHVYAIDAGANALLPLVSLPHCGAVVSRDQVERMDRLLSRLAVEVARRQQLLAAAGFAGLAEQRAAAAPAERLPWMLLLLDQWEGFVAGYENYDYGRLVDTVVRLLREGPAVGLRAVVTGDRSVLSGQISTVFDRRFVLRLAEPSDYGFAGINLRAVPSSMPPGRALEPGPGGELLESQVALLDPDPFGVAQVAALQRLARAAPAAVTQRPLRVDDLPVRVTVDELDLGSAPDAPLWTLVGAGGDELGPVGVDLMSEGPGFTIAGPPRSGRSTALVTMARFLRERDVPVIVLTPRRSPLRDLYADSVADDADALPEAIGDRTRYVVLVDDAELLHDSPMDEALAEVLWQARDGEHGVVLAGLTDDLKSAYRGFAADALRSRSGLLLAVRSPDDGDVFGVRLPRNAAGAGPAGRGVLVRLGVPEPVQVAVTT